MAVIHSFMFCSFAHKKSEHVCSVYNKYTNIDFEIINELKRLWNAKLNEKKMKRNKNISDFGIFKSYFECTLNDFFLGLPQNEVNFLVI